MSAGRTARGAREIVITGATALVFTAVGNACAYRLYRPYAPPLLHVWAAAVALLVLFHAGVIVSAVMRFDKVGHADPVTRTLRRTLELWTLGIVLGVIWALLPYGPPPLQLATMVFVASYASAVVLSGADQQESNALLVIAAIGSLLSVAAWQDIPYWPEIDLFLLTFLASLLVLDRTLQGQVLQLRAARDARTQFMAAASHDLGQPLQAARLFLEQAMASPDGDRRQSAADNTRSALGAMERLIHQMLDHLRGDEGALDARLRRFALGELIGDSVAQFTPLATMSGIRLRTVPTRRTALADPAMVGRALGNLLDNAIRHSGGTRVIVGVRRRGDRLRVWVVDDGRGLGEDVRRHAFRPFAPGAGGDGRSRSGMGIGLSSVRALMASTRGSSGFDPRWRGGAALYLDVAA